MPVMPAGADERRVPQVFDDVPLWPFSTGGNTDGLTEAIPGVMRELPMSHAETSEAEPESERNFFATC